MSSYEEGYWDYQGDLYDQEEYEDSLPSPPREVFDKSKIAPRADGAGGDAVENSSSIDSSGSFPVQKSKKLKTTETSTASPSNQDPGASTTKIECPICLENVALPDTITSICGHIFCSKCLTVWIKMKEICPICQQQVTIASIVPPELFQKTELKKD